MPTRILRLPAAEVIRLLREDTRSAHGQPELDRSAWRDYVIEEDFDRDIYDLADSADRDLVTEVATFSIEPRVERDYWVLKLVAERDLGPLRAHDEDALERSDISLEEFETALRAAGRKRVVVRLDFETADARRHFGRWLAQMRRRYPDRRPAEARAELNQQGGQSKMEHAAMTTDSTDTPNWTYVAREVVGVCHDGDALEATVNSLEDAGFDRAAISVLASDAKAREQVDHFYKTVRDVEDSGKAPLGTYVSRDERVEGEAAAIGVPFYIGGMAGAIAVAATGGALALAVAAAIVAGAAGAGLGSLLALAIARHHQAAIAAQLKKGGLVLWVGVRNAEAEKRALAVLNKSGATDVHVHQISREWTARDIPLEDVQPDRWLGKEL